MRTFPALARAAVLTASLLIPDAASAWSASGHRAVALIAAGRLSASAKKAAVEILGSATLDAIAPCADYIRGQRSYVCAGLPFGAAPWSGPWHYVSIPITAAPADGAAIGAFCPGGACVTNQIPAEVKILQDPSVPRADKQLALAFLVHFVGDMHQPLHCATEIIDGVSDQGGKFKSVRFNGTDLHLHSLWDQLVQAPDMNDPDSISRRLIADLDGKDVGSWLTGDFVSAATLEGFEIAKTVIYPAYYAQDPLDLGAPYRRQMQPIVDDRLERAGVRLARLIELALAPPPTF